MKKIIIIAVITVFLCSISSCDSYKSTTSTNELKALQTQMTGSFDSSEQAAKDSTYYNISLHMYPIWKSKDGYWLYVEQALNTNQAKPYRQRVYKIEYFMNTRYVSKVYTLQNPEDFIGKWKTPEYFDQFDTSILKEREGCGVYLVKKGKKYIGGTHGAGCKSTMRGASYATSQVTIKPNVIESWDRGFNAKDEHVWGAEKAGYIFERLK
ncbi:chromophore lyase CpcT/CpeT [Kordia sp. YSTF-M3]|uniref:Chromophore lyase CpcT/CpeT n=1 Tax=Kordia aestuariivivens TaxID=2759037 RepID=A0ABR7QE08_9FLAO|nr:chromophore lyase CpcT/CpeT [Kordia aestuariivivens]MBC8756606.1 chromophore lyase CpcT/CpeT [Kordia aestuariivivens]